MSVLWGVVPKCLAQGSRNPGGLASQRARAALPTSGPDISAPRAGELGRVEFAKQGKHRLFVHWRLAKPRRHTVRLIEAEVVVQSNTCAWPVKPTMHPQRVG